MKVICSDGDNTIELTEGGRYSPTHLWEQFGKGEKRNHYCRVIRTKWYKSAMLAAGEDEKGGTIGPQSALLYLLWIARKPPAIDINNADNNNDVLSELAALRARIDQLMLGQQ